MFDFDQLARFRGVIVTGAHRSGTTIAGRIIASELDRLYATESQIKRKRRPAVFPELIRGWMEKQADPWVLHGASCFRFVEQIQAEDVATVFVRRDFDNIRASQIRARGSVYCDPNDCIVKWKHKKIANPFEMQYEELAEHPMFYHDRAGWRFRQIGPDEDALTTSGGK